MKNLIALIFALFVFAGCGTEEKNQAASFKEFSPNEEVALKGVNGKTITLVRKNGAFAIKGDESKILMIDIFGTFCPPCQKEAAELTKYQLENSDKFTIIGLTHFENVTDDYVLKEFVQKYNAYYFITNDQSVNDRLSEQIVRDIGYKHEIALPFKVVIKDGEYQILTDVDSGEFGVKYYLGGIKVSRMKQDLQRIYGSN
ncbi:MULTISPECIES: TlpA disulfide reductase family protein [Campylobacter]|uniref:TlpA disulfide reductase family protein n=1 Tax=Campylobacter TaxID=194 RepID=UPI00146FDCA8|nr:MULTISPECIES: TlpA disulfide reductase family protein [Campylobacter]MBN7288615.1 TlpA family protein disulfide reductase [Campylobacter curvus]MDU6828337.1 TlpA disulfide reductase family protein [Campylobacter sp.]